MFSYLISFSNIFTGTPSKYERMYGDDYEGRSKDKQGTFFPTYEKEGVRASIIFLFMKTKTTICLQKKKVGAKIH